MLTWTISHRSGICLSSNPFGPCDKQLGHPCKVCTLASDVLVQVVSTKTDRSGTHTLTVMKLFLIVTLTPSGIGTGCLPILDSLHSVTSLLDREVTTRGCCCLKGAVRPVKVLCKHCACAMLCSLTSCSLLTQQRLQARAGCGGSQQLSSACPICLCISKPYPWLCF